MLTQREIAVHHDTFKSDKYFAVVDGKIVKNLYVDPARRMLHTAQMIAELETAGT